MNSARLTIERNDVIIYERIEPMDKFQSLRQTTGPEAHVGMNMGVGQDFGKLKVGASVTLSCDQNEAAINAAGYQAFTKCMELVEQGMKYLAQNPEVPT